MRRQFWILPLVALTACATPQKYKAEMKSMIGLSEEAVVARMKEARLGHVMTTYRVRTRTTLRFIRNQYISFDQLHLPNPFTDLNCITTFTFRNGVATSYHYIGDKCVAF